VLFFLNSLSSIKRQFPSFTPSSQNERPVFICNATTLLNQLDITLSVAAVYKSHYPAFDNISSLLTVIDQAILITKFHDSCLQLWRILSVLLTKQTRNITIRFITGINLSLTAFLSSSLWLSSSGFTKPKTTVEPSIIEQVTSTEIMDDPCLKNLTRNYYYPLSSKMVTSSMQIDSQDSMTPTSGSFQNTVVEKKKVVTVENSMEVISELINEIQASDKLDLNIRIPEKVEEPPPSSSPRQGIRFSLARQKRSISSVKDVLPSLHKFFHVLLGIQSVHILPVRDDSKATPIKQSHKVNELMVVGARVFFKAGKSNSASLAGDYHISTSLSFDELCSHEVIMNWLTLHGYYLVLCDCQTSDMIKNGFLS
jgi:hypothetical protein